MTARLRPLTKNWANNCALIDESNVVPGLVLLLWCSDLWMQEHTVTTLLNLSLLEENKAPKTNVGVVNSLIYMLKMRTKTLKHNTAWGSNRGKKDTLMTLYKLCSVRQNKERVVSVKGKEGVGKGRRKEEGGRRRSGPGRGSHGGESIEGSWG
ncbi:E3 ubiquitin-protein ligase SPL11 [Spatholobus suberectus]|nr:E3 ubiquitin-protein ligase SPL11 [Spatholobus suberectus]